MKFLGKKKNTAEQNWKALNELMAMQGEPDAVKEYWAVDLKTGRKSIILRLRFKR